MAKRQSSAHAGPTSGAQGCWPLRPVTQARKELGEKKQKILMPPFLGHSPVYSNSLKTKTELKQKEMF